MSFNAVIVSVVLNVLMLLLFINALVFQKYETEILIAQPQGMKFPEAAVREMSK